MALALERLRPVAQGGGLRPSTSQPRRSTAHSLEPEMLLSDLEPHQQSTVPHPKTISKTIPTEELLISFEEVKLGERGGAGQVET